MQKLKNLKSKTILLVEDETVIRENIASMLRFFFKEVYTAFDGYDGLDKFELYKPDIVMTDLKMPEMGGFELIEEIRKKSDNTYTIIVSAHTDTELLIDAIHKNVDRYIIKPVTEDELFEAFETYLKKLEDKVNIIELSPNIKVELDKHLLIVDGIKIHINKKETQLLNLLNQSDNKTVSYEEIEEKIWGSKSMSLSAIRTLVRDLRKKLGTPYLINISGIGYRLK